MENTIAEKAQEHGFLLQRMEMMGHEQVVFCNDKASGLKAIIAIHNTTLGPSLGGTRMWNYKSEAEALNDVLRLSRGMTYKSAISGLNLGGGKAVIIANPHTDKSEALFRRFGKFVNSLGGKYITAEDVGVSPKEMTWVNMETNHVSGLPGKSGDPSPVTAYGVYWGMKAAAMKAFGSDSLKGKRISVQGVGHVGEYLIEMLEKEEAEIFITDIHKPTLDRIAKEYKVTVVSPEDIYDLDVDIYSPCALGATVNDETLAKLKCKVIAGAANNQLLDEVKHGQQCKDMGIVYAPDYLINAGGVINCFFEVKGYNKERVMALTEDIYNTTLAIFDKAEKENIPTYLAANKMAEERIEKIGKIKLSL
ncbi:MAG: Glu/Leu/Phe/Val family dehydrogenase [Flavobacteriales bacterium]